MSVIVRLRDDAAPLKTRLATVVAGVLLAGLAIPVNAQCSATALGVDFGGYDPFSGAAVDSTGTVTVSCDIINTYSIALSTGGSGSYTPRTLFNGSYTLDYNLFVDSALSTIWGDGTGGTSTSSGSIGLLLLPNDHTIYGRIPGGQNPAAGSYSDTITVTVTY